MNILERTLRGFMGIFVFLHSKLARSPFFDFCKVELGDHKNGGHTALWRGNGNVLSTNMTVHMLKRCLNAWNALFNRSDTNCRSKKNARKLEFSIFWTIFQFSTFFFDLQIVSERQNNPFHAFKHLFSMCTAHFSAQDVAITPPSCCMASIFVVT